MMSLSTAGLLPNKDFGGSMIDLHKLTVDEEEPRIKESKGLLRRAFSSRRKKRNKSPCVTPCRSPRSPRSPNELVVPRSPACWSPACGLHEPLRSVRSNPSPAFHCEISPASDLAARRGVFSRRHYGSVELLISTDTDGAEQTAGRFRLESGDREIDEASSPVNSPIHLENPEYQTRWYFKYFLGKLHQTYVGCDSEKEPFFLSVVVTDANNHNVPQYRAILWRKTGYQKICLSYNPAKPVTVKAILSHFDLHKIDKGPKEIFNPEIQKELLVLEEQEGSVNFKFGVLFAKNGQTSDNEMYGNEYGSDEFTKFYSMLGERVKLKGWENFRGGLDSKTDTTGTHTIYTVFEGHEVMFHVSTLLPYSSDNKQQVERKRHIGNDIVNMLFIECEDDTTPNFRPSMMKTHFTHIYGVVTYSKSSNSYRLWVYSEESVPLFGPPLPCPAIFTDHQEFRDFLLVKLINGEKAAFNTPVFAQKRQRTLEMLLRNLYQEQMPENSKNNMLNRRAFSDIIPENVHGSRRKEEARQSEFLRIGQSLKLKTILRGDAPTSLVSSGALLKQQPWDPQCFAHDFQHDIICGDSWGDKLIVATPVGTFMLEEGSLPRMIIDKTVPIKQLNVVEAYGLLIFRADKGKDSRIHVFRLIDFEGEQMESSIRSKNDIKDHKIERTKGCHLYALSRPGNSHLRMIVAVGKRLHVMMWKYSSAWCAWCPSADNEMVDEFQFLRELQAFEVPTIMTLVDGTHGDNQICVGYKNQFDLINEKNGDTLQLYQIESTKASLVTAVDIYEDDEAELLLCYNHISHFQKLTEESSNEFDFHWNAEPYAIVCAFPYVMAFTPDTLEIRLIINGSLVHTMTMPKLALITSKCDIYFISKTTNHRCWTASCDRNRETLSSPPASPNVSSTAPSHIYKIPLTCLIGQITSDRAIGAPASPIPPPQSLLSPLVNTPEQNNSTSSAPQSPHTPSSSPSVSRPRSPTNTFITGQGAGLSGAGLSGATVASINNGASGGGGGGLRSPLLKKSLTYLPVEGSKYRLDSNSSSTDSGIHLNRLSEGTTPPCSPFFSLSTSVDEDETVIL